MAAILFRQWLPALFLLLAGCSGLQTQPPQASSAPEIYRQHLAELETIKHFDIRGRIGVQTNPRGFSGGLHWQHAPASDAILLYSPLGGQVAQIDTAPAHVVLTTSDGKRYEAADAATLTQKTLGWSLPMHGLPDWVLGRPSGSTSVNAHWDDQGRLLTLQQDGWDIEYDQYVAVDGQQLPTRVSLKSPKVNLKLVIEQWSLGESRQQSEDILTPDQMPEF